MNAVEFINEHLDPMKVLEYYNFQEVTDKGQMIRARCKIHGGDNPTAFCWNKENNLWFCYTGDCGGGDVFSLIEKLEKCNFKTAVQKAAEILSLDINDMEVVSEDRIRTEHLKWLNKQIKKQTKEETKEYVLPYTKYSMVNDNFMRFDEDVLTFYGAKFCDLFPSETGFLYNKLVIPLFENNKIIGCALRDTTGNFTPKWYYTPEHIKISRILYNYDLVRDLTEQYSDITEIILTEGIFDVWAYHRIKLNNAVAVFGSSLSDEQIKLILQLNLDVTLSFDNDKAGNKAREKAKKAFKNKVTLRDVILPEGKDPADLPEEELLKAYLERKKII